MAKNDKLAAGLEGRTHITKLVLWQHAIDSLAQNFCWVLLKLQPRRALLQPSGVSASRACLGAHHKQDHQCQLQMQLHLPLTLCDVCKVSASIFCQ